MKIYDSFRGGGGHKTSNYRLTAFATAAVASIVAFSPLQCALASTWYWTGGGGDSNWFTAANWNSAADGSGDDATALASGDSFTFGGTVEGPLAVVYNPSGSFSIGAITFASGCGAVTVSGEKIASVASIANNSTSKMEFENEVKFSSTLDVTQNSGIVKFTGGATGSQLARATDIHGKYTSTVSSTSFVETSGTKVCSDGKYYLPNATFHKHNADFHMESGAYAEVKAALIKQNSYGKKLLGTFYEGAVFKITGTFEVNGNNKNDYITHYFCNSGNGTLIANKILATGGGCLVPARYNIIGPGGIIRGRYGYVRPYNSGTHEFGAYADWTMAYSQTGSNTATEYFIFYKESSTTSTALVFDTTDYNDKTTGRKITSEAPIGAENASSAAAMSMTVKGKGRFVFANTSNVNIFSGGLTVQDSATVEVNKNSWPGKGKVTMNGTSKLILHTGGEARTGALVIGAGATLEIPEAGAATPGGATTLAAGATLAFNFTDDQTGPSLAASNGLTANGAVKVRVTAANGIRPSPGSRFALVTGAKLSDASKFVLEEKPSWAGWLGVENGNLVLTVPRGFCIFVK